MQTVNKELALKALEARKNAYAPYSIFSVGAAVLVENGAVFTGSNIENAAFSPSCCGERVAIFEAVSKGHRIIRKIAIAGGKTGDEPTAYIYPCGVCRQVMREFSDPEKLEVLLVKSLQEIKITTLEILLPHSFGKDQLG